MFSRTLPNPKGHLFTAIIVVLYLGAVPGAGHAATCSPGYYPDNGVCTICPQYYACPDGNMRIKCEADTPTHAEYTEGPGATECLRCPPASNGGAVWHSEEGLGISQCREMWEITWPSGAIGHFSCRYGTDGYMVGVTSNKCMVDLYACPAGYAARSPWWTVPNTTRKRYWLSNYDDVFVEPCSPAGVGYYSADDTTLRTACPAGTSTHTETAVGVDECLPLCAAGMTHMRAGTSVVNIWPVRYSTPSLNIRTPGGNICYVSLAEGQSSGVVNLKYNNVIYHAVN